MKADLALTLALQNHPVVVPAGKEFAGHQQLLEAECGHVGPGICDEFRKSTHFSDVNDDVWRQSQVVSLHSNEVEPGQP